MEDTADIDRGSMDPNPEYLFITTRYQRRYFRRYSLLCGEQLKKQKCLIKRHSFDPLAIYILNNFNLLEYLLSTNDISINEISNGI